MDAHPLAELFPMIGDTDLQQLADDIAVRGQEEPIVLYEGRVLDGRNRLRACVLAGVEPLTMEYGGTDPLGFVLSHNLHRRHLSESQRAIVAANIVDWTNGTNQYAEGSANLQTQKKAAERLSISERAIAAAKRVRDRGVEELSTAIRDGKVSVHAGEAISHLAHEAQREVLAQEEREIIARAKAIRAERQRLRHAERLANMRAIETAGHTTAPGRVRMQYPVIYADPPWKFDVRNEETGREKSAENHYPTMDTDAICQLFEEIGSPATPNAVLFLWATNPMLLDGIRVLQAWGFRYIHHWVWDKEVAGTGYWGRDRHEILLIGKRGNIPAPLPGSQPETVYREKKGRHSAKPDFYAETIERLYPDVPRLEMFCRKPRPGTWDAWGYEVGEPVNEAEKVDDATNQD
ncbi:N6-adenosine-specific RNA methylase IME4 [Phyllobacterium sp. YR620]|uniref:MT-A70 family methyltransferase n=1 Tax=Phyllobacterium sp. YR620 TaxID=1881066 RepID=UPI00088610A2|nr:MT-A70 family methyltransferase [Phyllobacterium sp. YR620]SDP92377.1 N6-adenosine-specific RNA methylase IME4 [Phyllobacterium sp. YR620]